MKFELSKPYLPCPMCHNDLQVSECADKVYWFVWCDDPNCRYQKGDSQNGVYQTEWEATTYNQVMGHKEVAIMRMTRKAKIDNGTCGKVFKDGKWS